MKIILSLITTLLFVFPLLAQTGVIKGTILDQQSEMPIIGATVQLMNGETNAGTTTDIDGYFRLTEVPLGRNVLQVTYVGYAPQTLPNIEVTSGKEVVLTINIEESISELNEVVVTANKDQPQNEMATISARQFSLEEVNRYSGGRGDVARLAANFAGVSSPDDSRNDIVVRGNSPLGVLWRIEGIPVPNPNHFATFGTTGAPVSALNANVMRNSDFMTSAFPAEYGNALAGVFDIGFRKGNKDKNEFMFQMGAFTGLEGMAEGPLGKKGGSYVVAGRYSLVGLFGGLSSVGTAAVPDYRDVAFNVDLGDSKLGRFSIFGIGGSSDINFLADEISEDDLFSADDSDAYVTSQFGVVGLKHNLIIGDKTYVRTVLGASTSGNTYFEDRYLDRLASDEKLRIVEFDNNERRYTLSSFINSKLSARQTLRAGVLVEYFNNDNFARSRENSEDFDGDGERDWFSIYDFDGGFTLAQPYAQTQYRINEKLTANAGLHAQYASLNEQFVLEPRASLSYDFLPNQKLTLAYGLHHQQAPLPILFLEEQVGDRLMRTNEDLEFTRSQHYVLGYDVKLGSDWRLKSEVYYQDIDNAPIDPFPSSFSILTEGADFGFSDTKTGLINGGTGFNRGVELTIEKFYSNGYYALLTGSLFESKYEGSDGIERNTPFSNGYVLNVLGGKEWDFGSQKQHAFVVNGRFTTSGGRWYTPIDLAASQEAGRQVLNLEETFGEQYENYLRLDVKFGVKINSTKRKLSHQFFMDLQNVTNNENIFALRYSRLTNDLNRVNQIGFFPDFLYRLQF
ncbi:MAG: carboxypeptidase-like regulatory domain-containing protein [Bacteroidota bacterium]